MLIHILAGNDSGTRIDKELEVPTMNVEDIFAELAQLVKWGKTQGSQKITLTVTDFHQREGNTD